MLGSLGFVVWISGFKLWGIRLLGIQLLVPVPVCVWAKSFTLLRV